MGIIKHIKAAFVNNSIEKLQNLRSISPEVTAQKKKAATESTTVTALRRHIKILNDMNDDYSIQLGAMSKELMKLRSGNTQDRLIEAGIQMFSGQFAKPTTPLEVSPAQKTLLETGVKLTDEQIKEKLNLIPADKLPMLSQLDDLTFASTIRQLDPAISDETIIRSHILLKEMVVNA